MAQRVFVTGASGFVGSAIVDELLSRGVAVSALVRDGSRLNSNLKINVVSGDVFDVTALARGIEACDAVIHLVGIIAEKPSKGVTFERVHVEGTRAVVAAAIRAGVRRFVHMSAIGARGDPNASRYHQTKFEAEQVVQASGLDFTIFRPSMIHGPRGEFTRQVVAWARKQALPYLAMPYFGRGVLGLGGGGLIQPIFVADVARAFVDALDRPAAIGGTYEIAGQDRITWPRFYEIVSRAVVGKRRMTLPIPAWYAKLLTRIVPRSLLPFNREQVIMSQEDNVADLSQFERDFGWTPRGVEESVGAYASQMDDA